MAFYGQEVTKSYASSKLHNRLLYVLLMLLMPPKFPETLHLYQDAITRAVAYLKPT